MKEITQDIKNSGLRAFIEANFQEPEKQFFIKSNAPDRKYYEGEEYWDLHRYETYYLGLQHEDKRYNWDGTTYVPEVEKRLMNQAGGVSTPATGGRLAWYLRRPYIREQLCPVIVDRFSDLLFSKRNRPAFSEYKEEFAPFFNKLVIRTKFWSRMLWARDQAGAMGTVVVGVVLRNGKPEIQVLNAKNCHPLFKGNDPNTGELDGLEVMFMYQAEVEEINPYTKKIEKKNVSMLYRRMITAKYDIAAVAPVTDEAPVWKITAAYQNDLGFVPFVWIQNDGACNDAYGFADCDQELDNLDALDAIITQSFRGTLYNSDPTLVLELANKDRPDHIQTGSSTALILDRTGNETAKILEMNGAGPKTGLEIEERIRKTILRDVRCVLPEELVNANTASEIQARVQAMIDRVDRMRENWEPYIIDLMGFVVRMLNTTYPEGGTVASGIPWLKGVTIPTEEDIFELVWPALSEIDENKIQAKVAAYASAIMAGIMSRETAVKKLSADLGFSRPHEELARILAEKQDEFLQTAIHARASMTRKAGGAVAKPEKPEIEDDDKDDVVNAD